MKMKTEVTTNTENDPTTKIRVNSFDFDGCLFNQDYINSDEKDVIKANQTIFSVIKEQNHNYLKNIIFIGSNRQDKNMDDENKKKGGKVYGSCFPAIISVSEHLNAKFDNLLLADIYADLQDGESYRRAMLSIEQSVNFSHASWIWDESKATIIYAQTQKVANSHPSQEIIFNFFDDRDDILSELNDFFNKYPELLPSNVTLVLHKYEGGTPGVINSIQGNGFIDENYRQTVKEMGAITKSKMGIDKMDTWSRVYVTRHIQPEHLKNRTEAGSSIAASSSTVNQGFFSPKTNSNPDADADADDHYLYSFGCSIL